MVCGENVSVCVRVKELSNQVQIKMRETSVKSIEYRNKLEKGLLLRKLESQSELVGYNILPFLFLLFVSSFVSLSNKA